jgi:GT2 family glycosyltransferase
LTGNDRFTFVLCRFTYLYPVTLSIIIVSYNVKDLLEQCLYSVQKAISGTDAEIIVIDNASSDNSIEYLHPKFPSFKFIENKINTGFAKANNQALQTASGRFILFLNPDTLVPEDCFNKCIGFMDSHPQAGALGVRMVNEKKEFLKESKRGLPTPAASFWKLSGVTKIFPRSKIFSGYYLGHLNENSTHEVDVISGAFMLVRKEVLDKTGGFDEIFFMYAEDIDLSYRIQKLGYKNYYFADTTIVHYKGASTKKDFKYVKMFYKAMSLFVKKHYGTGPYSMFLDTGIFLRGSMEAARLLFRKKSS